ncbi:FYVE zinc finger-domain-containing protein [Chaetomium tenue]|uniref:FYVE zinc finger-domain-containing protein n=1 Tax=Chaetomium tenue TaxID=1854479 RepID=A0ACB7PNQ4_9PEZI|nr:FYVE zinc finger-domain-containing protein [Chaetomium globosum]
MATPNAAGSSRQPHVPAEIQVGESPSSTSSSAGRDHDSIQTCRWRTAQYHDQECARYFDCPSHVVERALLDTEQRAEFAQEDHQEQDNAEDEEDTDEDDTQDAVSPLSEDGEEENHDRIARSPSPEIQVPAAEVTNTAAEASGTPEVLGTQHEGTAVSSSSEIAPGDSLHFPRPLAGRSGSGEVQNTLPVSPVPQPLPINDGAVPRSQAANTSASSLASVTSPTPTSPPIVSTPMERVRSGVVLPRWQPDSEQTYCPICGTQFSIFVRKHHCRKCGRVVCNSCSPHRITIPHQYIVRPPGAPRPLSQGPSLSLLDSQGWYPDFGGGERVRLCNPCVPDPNTAPPQDQVHQARPRNELSSPTRPDNSLSSTWGFNLGPGVTNDTQTRTRSVTLQPGHSSSARPQVPPLQRNEARILWGTPPAYYRSSPTSQGPQPYPGMSARSRPIHNASGRPGPSTAAGPSSSSSATRHFHSVVPPRPQIAEEDECPVCHRELPPRTLPNFEALREAHITSCITSHSRYGGSAAASSPRSGDDDDLDALPSAPPRRTGMFPYAATEKDCVDSAECSICLEEFEVGVAMARLECLCRFHRACINAWWERHPGRCPMHQHDGLGY